MNIKRWLSRLPADENKLFDNYGGEDQRVFLGVREGIILGWKAKKSDESGRINGCFQCFGNLVKNWLPEVEQEPKLV